MYLAKRLACSVIYQIDEIFIAAGDRERDARTHTGEHLLRTTRLSSPRILSDLLSANVQIACRIRRTRVAHRDADSDATRRLFRFASFILLHGITACVLIPKSDVAVDK